jgi:hypothetical protein
VSSYSKKWEVVDYSVDFLLAKKTCNFLLAHSKKWGLVSLLAIGLNCCFSIGHPSVKVREQMLLLALTIVLCLMILLAIEFS